MDEHQNKEKSNFDHIIKRKLHGFPVDYESIAWEEMEKKLNNAIGRGGMYGKVIEISGQIVLLLLFSVTGWFLLSKGVSGSVEPGFKEKEPQNESPLLF